MNIQVRNERKELAQLLVNPRTAVLLEEFDPDSKDNLSHQNLQKFMHEVKRMGRRQRKPVTIIAIPRE